MKVLGAILRGGRARRFGSDKALALLDGRPLIDHVRTGLAPQVEAMIACGRTVDGLETIADHPLPDLGPLGGLNAALHAASKRGYDAVLSVPCDTPFLPIDLRRRLERATPAYVTVLPVMGLWPAALAPALADFVATDARRSMRGWADLVGAVAVELDQPLVNINTPGDLDNLRAVAVPPSHR